jgi:BCD family chlorophyll transporter-like MFS transporter
MELPDGVTASETEGAAVRFREAFRQVWSEGQTRGFAIFVFVSMLAYSMQDLILEPFAGIAFGLSVGETTTLSGVQNGGVLVGMIAFAVIGSLFRGRVAGSPRFWTVAGCLASGGALFALAASAAMAPPWPLGASVFFLGLANGTFAVAAIGSMMDMVGEGRRSREGVRMGLWGAAQAIAFGLGGLIGTMLADLASHLLASRSAGYAMVLAAEGILFIVASGLAARLRSTPTDAGIPAGLAVAHPASRT